MKNTLLILSLLLSLKIMACGCNSLSIQSKYVKSDVVAKVKILKIYKNVDSYLYYKADILVKKMYKGKGLELKSIYIYGDNDGDLIGRLKTSCDIFIPEGAELLIYTSKNERGEYTLGMCSGYLYLNNYHKSLKEKYKLELKILKKLKRKKVTFINKDDDAVFARNLNDSLKNFNNIKLRKQFAIFEIDFNKPYSSEIYDLQTENIKVVSGFNKKLDRQLIDIIKKNKWQSRLKKGNPSKRLLIIKYKKATENEPSRLFHDLI